MVKTAVLLSQGGYDVIFMDLNMPVMDGFESVRRIREFEAEVAVASLNQPLNVIDDATDGRTDYFHRKVAAHNETYLNGTGDGVDENEIRRYDRVGKGKAQRSYVIALTGLSAERDRKEAVTCGVDAFLTKPVRFTNVGRILEERCWVKGEEERVGCRGGQ